MRFHDRQSNVGRLLSASDYCRAGVSNKIVKHSSQRNNARQFSEAGRGETNEHLIDGSEKCIRRSSFKLRDNLRAGSLVWVGYSCQRRQRQLVAAHQPLPAISRGVSLFSGVSVITNILHVPMVCCELTNFGLNGQNFKRTANKICPG